MNYTDFISVQILPLVGAFFMMVVFREVISWFKDRNKLPYPPGPKPKPIIGNLLDFPTEDLDKHCREWGIKYNSTILHASALGTHIIILNSLGDAEELLDRRANNYSDRFQTPMINLLGFNKNMAVMAHGPRWRRLRRIAQQNFRLDAVSAHEPIQLRRIHIMLKGLLDDPESVFTHHKVFSVSIPLESMYGYNVTSLKDPFVTEAQETLEPLLRYSNLESSLINLFPILGRIPSWIPGATQQKLAARNRDNLHRLETEPIATVHRALDEGRAVPSILSRFIEAKCGTPEFDEESEIIGELALTVYAGASDTIICALDALVYILAIRPDIQKKAQHEIDGLIGSERLPDFSDRAFLPYVDALYLELLRYYPPTPMALSHRAQEDDTYKGYFIPKGSMIFPNVWAMTRDETLYPDPFVFKPERFLDENGQLIENPRVLTYGFGRRICVGKHLASSTLWIAIASLLASFDIGKAKDSKGNEIEISDQFVFHSITAHKTPFECSITPRSQSIRCLVEEAVAAEKL